MQYNFQIVGIHLEEILSLLKLEKSELKRRNISKMVVDKNPGYPCRLSLKDVEIGEEVILFPYEHHQVKSPYQSSGPIFIGVNAQAANLKKNEIPLMLKHRLLSLRVYDKNAMMIDAHTVEGKHLEAKIQSIFAEPKSAYIHVHNTSPGCYNCQINRID